MAIEASKKKEVVSVKMKRPVHGSAFSRSQAFKFQGLQAVASCPLAVGDL